MSKATWVVRTALRDARGNLRVLLFVASTIVLGVAGIVALYGFNDLLEQQMTAQSKTLFGADLVVELRGRFDTEHEAFLDTIPGRRAREIKFSSMIVVPSRSKSRFVMVSALSQGYPLYGEILTQPKNAAAELYGTNQILVDTGLATQFDLSIGDVLRLGEKEFILSGLVKAAPGAIAMQEAIAPRVYISASTLEATNLLQRGSRLRSREYFRFEGNLDSEQLLAQKKATANDLYLRLQTSDARRDQFLKIVGNVTAFAQLVALVAVLLGALGAATIAHMYISRRTREIGMLRCIGARHRSIIALFSLQILVAGGLGAILGVVLGMFLGTQLPAVLGSFLPLQLPPLSVASFFSLETLGLGILIGIIALFSFSIVPLLHIGRISPMTILRLEIEPPQYSRFEKLLFVLCVFVSALVLTAMVVPEPSVVATYVGMLSGATLLFYVLAELGIRAIGGFRFRVTRFSVRQGIANITRPGNQTRVLLMVLGVSSFLVLSVAVFQQVTLARIAVLDTSKQANTLLFDVQPDQVEGVRAEIARSGLTVLDTFPLVTMRLAKVKGKTVSEILATEKVEERWPYTRMYRSSYRSGLESTETLLEGRVVEHYSGVEADETNASIVPVTLEKRIAERLSVTLGDTLEFDVEGVPMSVEVVGIREVDWQQLKPNFFVVFPTGVLEDAPQTSVITARASSESMAVGFQRDVVVQFPNVSVLDLRIVQEAIRVLASNLRIAAQLLGALCVCVAFVLLLGTILSTREQREKEFQILKFHGATQKTLLAISIVEFGILATVATLFALAAAHLAALAFSMRLFGQALSSVSPQALGLAFLIVLISVLVSVTATISSYRRSAQGLLR